MEYYIKLPLNTVPVQCPVLVRWPDILLKILPHFAHLEIQPNLILANLSLQEGPQSGMIIMTHPTRYLGDETKLYN